MKLPIRREFLHALRDYAAFRDRGYPEKALLKLVSDRYRLEGWERTALFRGVFSRTASVQRRRLITNRISNRDLVVDGYNVLYTISNYLYGRELFVATDGLLRDAGEAYPNAPDEPTLHRAIDELLRYLRRHPPRRVEVILDAPKSRSGELAAHLRTRLTEAGIPGTARTEQSADAAIKRSAAAVIATSDSGVIDAVEKHRLRRSSRNLSGRTSAGSLCDLPRLVLEARRRDSFVSLRSVLAHENGHDFFASLNPFRRAR